MLKAPPLPDRVAEILLARIRAGEFPPGSFLPSSRELERQFGVSRIVIREALRSLAAKGILRIYQGKGAQVCPADPAYAAEVMELLLLGRRTVWPDLMEVRQILEVAAAELAARRRTPEDLATLQVALEQMAAALTDAEAFAEWDVAFHHRLVRAAHNPILDIVTHPIGELLRASRLAILNPERHHLSQTLLEEHRAIYLAVERQDPAAAAEAMRCHLAHVAATMWRKLGQYEPSGKENHGPEDQRSGT